MKITIDPRKSVEQNAQTYFEKAKQARKKLAGARKALAVSLQKKEEEQKNKEKKIKRLEEENIEKELRAQKKQEWYEKFRWFYSSEGFLVIGGRDATTNEIIIKKHTEKNDVVFHTDMAGSPFFVIKTEGKETGEKTIQETANATLCFSRAWKMGLITTPTFWVKPEQVSKEANPGEYMAKGAFMIRGKTNYIPPQISCAIGRIEDGRIMCGPTEAVKKHCKIFFIVIQGKNKASEAAKIIKKKIGGDTDEIIKALPSGGVEIRL
jgi:predicted ribosome quality control (RQC) complex YloA/Tae2 family protein